MKPIRFMPRLLISNVHYLSDAYWNYFHADMFSSWPKFAQE